jgi:shikimate kinase / 3-dehydroquinate synthase
MDPAPLYLIGFMATGKTTVGRLVAAELGRRFLDLDEEIERESGKRIADTFRLDGESMFRSLEAAALRRSANQPHAVIACGGGTPCFFDNLAVMKRSGVVVALQASLEELVARALGDGGGDERPLLRGNAAALFAERAAIYAEAHLSIDVGGRTPSDVAGEIARRARRRLGHTRVAVAGGVPIHLAPLGSIGELHRELCGGRAVVVTDENVAAAGHAQAVVDALGDRAAGSVTVPAGERSKTLAEVERVASACVAAGLDRSGSVVAVGGGVVGDLAGLVGALLYRGVAVAQVPTTLLAMVDSAIGGKTGVDLPSGKNLVGAFWQPRFVLADVKTLATLPARERTAAFGEVVKYALLGEAGLWERLERGERIDDSELVLACARHKSAVVSADEFERTGARARLNLGHTVGHAIESASRFELLHGECVALGLVAAARVSTALGVGPAGLEARVVSVLSRMGLGTRLDPWLRDEVLAYIGTDKKRAAGKVRFIALEDIGRTRSVDLDLAELGRALRGPLSG